MPQIYVSYRRTDAGDRAHQIADWLAQKYGRENIVFDVESTPTIEENLAQSDVLLIVIGDTWVEDLKKSDETDAIKREVSAGLKTVPLVIPLLTDDDIDIRATQLPEDIKPMMRRTFRFARGGDTFDDDMEDIRDAIDKRFPPDITPSPTPKPQQQTSFIPLILVLMLFGAVVAFGVLSSRNQSDDAGAGVVMITVADEPTLEPTMITSATITPTIVQFTDTPAITSSPTLTPIVPTSTPTYTPTVPTNTPTDTPIPATPTLKPTNTAIPATPTLKPTNTPIPPTPTLRPTSTRIPFTPIPTDGPTVTPSNTPSPDAPPTNTPSPSAPPESESDDMLPTVVAASFNDSAIRMMMDLQFDASFVDILTRWLTSGGEFQQDDFDSTLDNFCVTGDVDVVMLARYMMQDEIDTCADNGREPLAFYVGANAVVVAVSADSDFVTDMSMDELAMIFTGADSWADVRDDFPDEPIQRLVPQTYNSLFNTFVSAVYAGDETPILRDDPTMSHDQSILFEGLMDNPYAVGIFGYTYYLENATDLQIISIDGVLPSDETIADGTYPLSSPMMIYTDETTMQEKPEVNAFINFMLRDIEYNRFDRAQNAYHLPSEALFKESKDTWFALNP